MEGLSIMALESHLRRGPLPSAERWLWVTSGREHNSLGRDDISFLGALGLSDARVPARCTLG